MKKNLKDYKALREYLKINTCFEIHDNVLYCKYCNETKSYVPREGTAPLKKHLHTISHIKFEERNLTQQRLKFTNSKIPLDNFDQRLLIALTKANIPIYKLQNPYFKSFIEDFTLKKVKDESYYRKHTLIEIFNLHYSNLKFYFSNKPIYLIFDETTDISGRYILNILIGECSSTNRENPFLFKVIELNKTNSENINCEIMQLLNTIYDGNVESFKNLKLLLSDGAKYAIKSGKMLKLLIPGLKHITCICHALHNICETIKNSSLKINEIISFLKRILVKNHENQRKFIEIVNLPLPKFPIITRWGTWIEFSVYLFNHFNAIKRFVFSLSDELQGILDIKKLFDDNLAEKELRTIVEHAFLTHAIKLLESSSLSTEEQVSIIKDVEIKIKLKEVYSERFDQIFLRNPDFQFFFNFNSLRVGEYNSFFRFVPLTSVAVEQSFSKFKYLLDDKRTNLTIENIEKLLMLYFNKEI